MKSQFIKLLAITLGMLTPYSLQGMIVEKQLTVASSATETFDLHLRNENLDPVHVALVEQKAPTEGVASWRLVSAVSSYGYTNALSTQSQEIKPSETITIKVPKISPIYKRWICWDTKPITGPQCGTTIPLEKEVPENEKTIDIISDARKLQLKEQTSKEKTEQQVVNLRAEIKPISEEASKSVLPQDRYLLKIKNLDMKTLHVALVAGIPQPQTWVGYLVSSVPYTLEPLTASVEIQADKKILLTLPKNIDIAKLWIYWDTKPIECKGVCNGSTVELKPTVTEDKKTVKLMTEERKLYLNNMAERLIERKQGPQTDKYALVTSGGTLSDEESRTLENRERTVKESVQSITGSAHSIPRIGICHSGGGLRAMFSAIGLSQGLNRAGLINAFLYAAGLSGSTWFLMKWLEQGGSPDKLDEIAETLRASMAKGLIPKELLDPVTKELSNWQAFKELAYGGALDKHPNFMAQFKATIICPNGVCLKTNPSLIDLWGYFLGRRLFKGNENKYQFTLSSLQATAQNAKMPLPIFTAIDTRGTEGYIESLTKWAWSNHEQEPPKNYKFLEVTPFNAALRSKHTLNEIPLWGLGRKYKSGWLDIYSIKEPSHNFQPFASTKQIAGQPQTTRMEFSRIEPSATQLLGAFGSAFTVSLGEVTKMMETTIEAGAQKAQWIALGAHVVGAAVPHLRTVGQAVGAASEVMKHVSKTLIKSQSDIQFFAGLGLYDFSRGGDEQLELRDAGVFYNLPLPPLFDKRRDLDIILVHDTSGDLHAMEDGRPMIGSELAKFAQYPQFAEKALPHDLRNNASFKTKMDALYNHKKMLAVFNDPRSADYNPDEVTVIYLPTIAHPNVAGLECSPTEKFGTFKLQYDAPESEQLMQYNRVLAEKNAEEIKEIIKAKTQAMNS